MSRVAVTRTFTGSVGAYAKTSETYVPVAYFHLRMSRDCLDDLRRHGGSRDPVSDDPAEGYFPLVPHPVVTLKGGVSK